MRSFPAALVAVLLICLAPESTWAQKLFCSPCPYSFGDVQIGKSTYTYIQLTNTGAQPVTIKSMSAQGSAFSYGSIPLPLKLNFGASAQLEVIFTPKVQGQNTGVIQVVSDAENSPVVMNVSGTGSGGSGAQLAITPATLNFGNVTDGSSATMQATLTASNAAVTISSDQSSNSQFSIVGLKLPLKIAVGKTASVTLQFSPNAAGPASAKATFVSNAVNSPTIEQLTGTGVAQANPKLVISPATLSFGSVNVGSSATKQATLTASNAAVTVSSDHSSNPEFSIVGMNLPLTIAAGKSVAVTLQFAPSAAGAASGKANFVSNAINSPTAEQLSGTGVAQSGPQLTVSPGTLSFGNVTVGSSATLQATLTASNAPVILSLDQSSSSEFVIQTLKLPLTISAGKSIPVTIQFTPNASGTASGKAGFISNALNSPTVEQLTGNGVAQGSHEVDLSWNAGDGNAVGYNIYRGTAQAGPFTEINTALDSSTTYTDSTVVSGTTYYYVATEVNNQGQESAYSNVAKAVIPNP
jgi:hypothetical protein